MINYVIQVVIFQALFLAVYDLFLSKETFFTKNRFYLITTAIISFILPLLRIPTLQKAVPKDYTIWLPEVVISPQDIIEKTTWYQNINYLDVLFWGGVVLFSVIFLIKLIKILQLISTNEIHPKKNYKLVLLPKNTKAFSFFNYIFLGREIPKEKQEKIIQHELIHSQQKHTLDLLFFELLKIVMWFNPMIYLYQNRISLVHEFISDEVVTKEEEKTSYINSLLSEIFQVEHISFINQFYKHSLIKKRIRMMTKNKSKQIKQLKYLLLVPVLASMLFYTACTNDELKVNPVTQKDFRVKYLQVSDDKIKALKSDEESYLDLFMGFDVSEYPEMSVNELSKEEKAEYDADIKELEEKFNKKDFFDIKILKMNTGRKAISFVPNFNKVKKTKETKLNEADENVEVINEDVPFTMVTSAPTFPGCPNGDKACFNKSMQEFVKNNFDTKLINSLGISSGRKRAFVTFKINTNGEIERIKVRAPHPKIKGEVTRVIKLLPKMKPGKYHENNVKVGYTLPITFNVE